MARYCFADIVAVDSDIITLLGPDGAAAVLHGSPRERRDGFLRAVAAAVPLDLTDHARKAQSRHMQIDIIGQRHFAKMDQSPPTPTSWPPCRAKCYTPSCEGDRDERTPR